MANSSALHRIHLRGPWSLRLDPDAPDGVQVRVDLPGDWTLGELPAGSVAVYTRRFHAPVRPPGGEQIWLLFPGVGGHGEVLLNGKLLGTLRKTEDGSTPAAAQMRIDGLMKPFNTLEVRLIPSGPTSRRGLFEAAILEFRSP